MAINHIRLSPMTESDLELLMSWRSHPSAYKFFKKQNKPLTWKEHFEFWQNRKNRLDFIIELNENDFWRKVGNLNFTKLDTLLPEIGIIIGENTLRGKGVGSEAISLGIKRLVELGYIKCQANINIDNISSIKLFSKFGFRKVNCEKNNAWHNYVLELNPNE